ncbi:MAG: 50S ribosome-binding GTPase [Planctomycetaceae bacterium]|nr:50S ribosome-binding GTPase [Planctomycetaceae bacterium]
MSERASYAAVLTPPGRGGIAVISLSGAGADDILGHIFVKNIQGGVPKGQVAAAALQGMQLGVIKRGDEVLDQVVLCRTSQGFEINIHGGPAVARAVLELLASHGAQVLPADQAPPALSAAHPKWNNPAIGREMLSAVIDARSPRVLAAISNQWSAGLSQLACELIQTLLHGVRPAEQAPPLTSESLREAARTLPRMRRLLDPPDVVLVGAPNVGKSTLINALTGRAVSIVHDQPGTTRDWVREPALLRDLPVYLTDTAGLWSGAAEAIDQQAIDRARACAAAADLVLLLDDRAPTAPQWLAKQNVICVRTKRDLETANKEPGKMEPVPQFPIPISARSGEGLDDLADAILERLDLLDLDPRAPAAFTQRQADLLIRAADALGDSDTASDSPAKQALFELLGR